MPTAAEHHTWSDYNLRFYEHLGRSQSSWQPWAMTALFYTVVHDVQSLLVQNSLHPATHIDRANLLRNNPRWSGLAACYDILSQRSREARYLCKTHTQAELALAEMAARQAQHEVSQLRPAPV